jgi:hypothetical protein
MRCSLPSFHRRDFAKGAEGLKSRHAAALVLVGCYLIVPSFTDRLMLLHGDPHTIGALIINDLSTWQTLQAYDTAEQCEAVRAALKSKDNGGAVKTDLQVEARFAQCIATDDPRLKGK